MVINKGLTLDSERAAKQTQNDGVTLNGRSEALISSKEELPFYFWTNVAGLVVRGVEAATGLTLIMVIGLMIKVRCTFDFIDLICLLDEKRKRPSVNFRTEKRNASKI